MRPLSVTTQRGSSTLPSGKVYVSLKDSGSRARAILEGSLVLENTTSRSRNASSPAAIQSEVL